MATYRLHIRIPNNRTVVLPDDIPVGEADVLLECDMPSHRDTSCVREENDPLLDLVESIPREEWSAVPSDAAANHDHYLYGAPKQWP